MEFENVRNSHTFIDTHSRELNSHTHEHSLISPLLFSQGEVRVLHLHTHLLIASDTFSL